MDPIFVKLSEQSYKGHPDIHYLLQRKQHYHYQIQTAAVPLGQPEGDDPGMSDLTHRPNFFPRNILLRNTKVTPNLKSEPTPDPFYAYPSYMSKERNDLFSTFKIGKVLCRAEEWVNLMREGAYYKRQAGRVLN